MKLESTWQAKVKTCAECGAEKELSEYHRDKTSPSGRVRICRRCKAEYDRRYRRDNAERCRRWKQKYYAAHREEINKKSAEYRKTLAWKDVQRRADIKYRKRFPERKATRAKLRLAIKNGVIQRGVCSICGATEDIQAHHADYSKPLEVIWLCPKHHYELHREAI